MTSMPIQVLTRYISVRTSGYHCFLAGTTRSGNLDNTIPGAIYGHHYLHLYHIHSCVCASVLGFLRATLCNTSMVQDYVVHHWLALYTTDHGAQHRSVVHNKGRWCTMQLGGAQHSLHNVALINPNTHTHREWCPMQVPQTQAYRRDRCYNLDCWHGR